MALVKEWREMQSEVGDQQSLAGSLRQSPYFALFKDSIEGWEKRLATLQARCGTASRTTLCALLPARLLAARLTAAQPRDRHLSAPLHPQVLAPARICDHAPRAVLHPASHISGPLTSALSPTAHLFSPFRRFRSRSP